MFLNIEEFVQALRNKLTNNNNDLKITLGADNDLDGLFSAILMDLGLYDLYEIEVETVFRNEVGWTIPVEEKTDILFLLDLAYENTPNYRKAASKAKDTFAIDHHITGTGFPTKVKAFNPCRNGEKYIPAVFLVRKVIEKLGKKYNDYEEYFATLGVLADAGINFTVKDDEIIYSYDPEISHLYENARTKFVDLFTEEKSNGFIYPHFKETIEALNLEAEEIGWFELYLRFINEGTSLSAVLSLVKAMEEKHQGAYQQLLENVPSEPMKTTKSGIWIIDNKTAISNGTLGRIIAEVKGIPVIIYSKNKYCRISARAPSLSKIDFIPLFDGFGGGHPHACGAYIPQKRLEEFIERTMNF